MLEMERIVGEDSWIATAWLKWTSVVPKIIQQAHLESGHKSRLRKVMSDLKDCGTFYCIRIITN